MAQVSVCSKMMIKSILLPEHERARLRELIASLEQPDQTSTTVTKPVGGAPTPSPTDLTSASPRPHANAPLHVDHLCGGFEALCDSIARIAGLRRSGPRSYSSIDLPSLDRVSVAEPSVLPNPSQVDNAQTVFCMRLIASLTGSPSARVLLCSGVRLVSHFRELHIARHHAQELSQLGSQGLPSCRGRSWHNISF